jgi:putative phage-type endonuclease
VQGSDEWKQLRLGKVTASRVADVMAKIKSGEAAGRADYRTDLVIERLTQRPTESFTNAAMAWGVENECFARSKYESVFNLFVEEVPFINHPTIEWFGASPDGLVGSEGLLEIKAPNSKQHIKYLNDGKPPSKYIPQMMSQMACTGRKWCDFVSFDPRMPEGLDFFVVRLERDEEYIKAMEAEVQQFLNEVEAELSQLRKKLNGN